MLPLAVAVAVAGVRGAVDVVTVTVRVPTKAIGVVVGDGVVRATPLVVPLVGVVESALVHRCLLIIVTRVKHEITFLLKCYQFQDWFWYLHCTTSS